MDEINSLFSKLLKSKNEDEFRENLSNFFSEGKQYGSFLNLLSGFNSRINELESAVNNADLNLDLVSQILKEVLQENVARDENFARDAKGIHSNLNQILFTEEVYKVYSQLDQGTLRAIFENAPENEKRHIIRFIDDDQLKKDFIKKYFLDVRREKREIDWRTDLYSDLQAGETEDIAMTMSSDEAKLEMIELLSKETSVVTRLIGSLSSEELIKSYLDSYYFNNPDYLTTYDPGDVIRMGNMLQGIKDDEYICQVIDRVADEGRDATVLIENIKDDGVKLDYIRGYLQRENLNLENTRDPYRTLASYLKEDDSKIKFISEYKIDDSKCIEMIKDDELKVELLRAGLGLIPPRKEWGEFFSTQEFKNMIQENLIGIYETVQMKSKVSHDVMETVVDQILDSVGGIDKIRGKESELLSEGSERLGLPDKLTFGVELEAEGMECQKTKMVFGQLTDKSPWIGSWTIKPDGSLRNGTEVVSPVLTDTEGNLSQVQYMSEMMSTIGFEENDTCGGHIHFGADFLDIGDGGKKGLKALRSIWKESEELFYKISNGEGKTTRKGASRYAGKIEDRIDSSINIETQEEYEVALAQMQEDRYYGINFTNMTVGGKNTIEFRMPNGTIDPKEIRENIFLFGRLMTVSREIAQNPELYAERMDALKQRDVSEAEKMEALLGLLFEDEQSRSVYRNRWISVRDSSIYDNFAASTPRFRRKDYSLRNVAKGMSEEIEPEEIQDFVSDVKETMRGMEAPEKEGEGLDEK